MFAFPVSTRHPLLFPYQIRNYWLDMSISTLESLKASKASLPLYPLSILPLLKTQTSSAPLPSLAVSIDVLLKQSEQLKDNFWPFELAEVEAPAIAKPAIAKPATVKPATVKKSEPVANTTAAKKASVKTEKTVTTQLPLIEEAQPAVKKAKEKTRKKSVAAKPEKSQPAEKKAKKPATKSSAKVEKLQAQNLTAIRGIGPVLAGKLAEKGITRFAQIAAWTAKDIDKFENEVMPSKLNGRIERDNWVIQAQFLEANC